GGAGGDGALAGRTAGPPDGQQGGKGAGAGVIPGRSPERPKAASGAGEQPPPRSAAVSARQSSPLPIVPQRERDPGCASLTRATLGGAPGRGNRWGSGGAGGDGGLAGRAAGPPDGQQGGKGAGAGVIPGRSPERPKAASGAGEQAPPRSAAVSARQSSPLPIVPQRERDPGCASLTRA